jgi:tRNA U55 pseudouridine synthase TruB
VGRFRLEDACTLDVLEAGGAAVPCARSMNALMDEMPAVRLTGEGLRRAEHGNSLAPHHVEGRLPETTGRVRLVDGGGELLAVAERRADGFLHPVLVLR